MSCKSKKSLFWSVILFCTTAVNCFSIRLWHVMKSGLYLTTRWYVTSSVVGLRRCSKALPKLTVTRKCHDHCLVVCCWSDPLQLSESQQTHYIWEVSSANQWDALHWKLQGLQPALVNRKGPVLQDKAWPYNQCFESWMNWATKLCLICHTNLTSHQLTTASSSILTAFCREKASTPAGGRKCFPRACWNLELQILMLQE